MKRLILICSFLMAFSTAVHAQKIAVKTNFVEWAYYGTINFGAEAALAPRWTIDASGGYNPWTFSDQKSAKHWTAQAEARFWFKEKFQRSFIGLHGLYSEYNEGMDKYRYEGNQFNVGLSYGYSLPLCDRWRLEANIGAGWIHQDYDKSDRQHYPGDIVYYPSPVVDKFGITRAGLSLIFIIK